MVKKRLQDCGEGTGGWNQWGFLAEKLHGHDGLIGFFSVLFHWFYNIWSAHYSDSELRLKLGTQILAGQIVNSFLQQISEKSVCFWCGVGLKLCALFIGATGRDYLIDKEHVSWCTQNLLGGSNIPTHSSEDCHNFLASELEAYGSWSSKIRKPKVNISKLCPMSCSFIILQLCKPNWI